MQPNFHHFFFCIYNIWVVFFFFDFCLSSLDNNNFSGLVRNLSHFIHFGSSFCLVTQCKFKEIQFLAFHSKIQSESYFLSTSALSTEKKWHQQKPTRRQGENMSVNCVYIPSSLMLGLLLVFVK